MTEPTEIIDAELIEDDGDGILATIPPPAFDIALREGMTVEETLITDWLDEQKSPHTKRSYSTSIASWRARISRERCCSFLWPHRPHAFAWRKEMEGEGLAPKTIDSRLIAIRSFYDHLCDRDDGARIPINPVKSKKLLLNQGAHQPTNALSGEEVAALTAAARKAGQEQRLLVLFLVVTGCRISEAVDLKVADLQRVSGSPVAMLTRKGNKRGPAAVDAQVFEMLTKHCDGSPPDAHVFQPHRREGRTGGPYSYSGAYKALNSIAKAAELVHEVTEEGQEKKSRVHPHVLRATLITSCIEANHEIVDIQDQVGHAKTETTRMYNRGGAKVRKMVSISGVMAQMADIDADE